MKPKNTAQEEIKVYIFRPYIPGVDTDGDEERIYAKSLEQAQLQISKQVYYRDLDPKYRVEYYTLIGIYPKDPNKAYGLDPFYHELCEHPPGSLWPPESGIRPYMPVKLGEARYRRYYLIWKATFSPSISTAPFIMVEYQISANSLTLSILIFSVKILILVSIKLFFKLKYVYSCRTEDAVAYFVTFLYYGCDSMIFIFFVCIYHL